MTDEKKSQLITVEQSVDPAARLSQEIVESTLSVLNDRHPTYRGHLVALLSSREAAEEYAQKLNAALPDADYMNWEAVAGRRIGEVRIRPRRRTQ